MGNRQSRPQPQGYITFVFHDGHKAEPTPANPGHIDTTTVAGMEHCQRGLQALARFAHLLGRKIYLPPVAHMLQTMHNRPYGPLDTETTWSRYFEFDHPLLPDPDAIVHDEQPIRGKITSMKTQYFDADVDISVLAKVPKDQLIAISHYPSENFQIYDCHQFAPPIENDPTFQPFKFKPSPLVKRLTKSMLALRPFNEDIAAVHVRRGDVLTFIDQKYFGYNGPQIEKITSHENVIKTLNDAVDNRSSTSVMIFSNETDPEWFDSLHKKIVNAGYGHVYTENTIPVFKYIEHLYGDRFLSYEVARQLFSRADTRISTLEDRLGQSTHKLHIPF